MSEETTIAFLRAEVKAAAERADAAEAENKRLTKKFGDQIHSLIQQRDAAIFKAKAAEKREAALQELRSAGWLVAIHNDYHLNGEFHTFWLFTHPNGRWVKGEGRTDDDAIARAALEAKPAIRSGEGEIK